MIEVPDSALPVSRKRQHQFLPKDARPEQGGKYLFTLEEKELYTAEITDYKGGCWATVQIESASEEFVNVYKPGMKFDIKVANYDIAPTSLEVK